MRRHLWLGLATTLLVACGGDDSTDPTTPDPEPGNAPPVIDAPATITLGEGQRLAVSVTASDPDGDAVTVSTTPAAGLEALVDESGVELVAGYGVAASALTVTADDGSNPPVTLEIPVTVQPLRWVGYQSWTTAEGPEEREHPATMVDLAGGQAFVLYGSGYHPQFQQMMDDLWRYDLATNAWSQVTPLGDLPPPGGSRRFAGVDGTGEGYLFGGYTAGGDDAELHQVAVAGDTLSFTAVQQENAPNARSLHSFAYDPVSERFVLFGGVSNSLFGDCWVMQIDGDGVAQWTELNLDPAPGGRYGTFSAFDERHGRLLVFGGGQLPQGNDPVNAATETWALDLRADPPAWSLVAMDSTPPGRRNGSMVWDEASSRMFVLGGTADAMTTAPGVFVLDARPGQERWHEITAPDAPPLRSSGTGFFDGQRAYFGFGNGASIYRDWAALGY